MEKILIIQYTCIESNVSKDQNRRQNTPRKTTLKHKAVFDRK